MMRLILFIRSETLLLMVLVCGIWDRKDSLVRICIIAYPKIGEIDFDTTIRS